MNAPQAMSISRTKYDPITHRNEWTATVYEARARKKDGVMTWRVLSRVGATKSCRGRAPGKFVREVQRIAELRGLEFIPNLRANALYVAPTLRDALGFT